MRVVIESPFKASEKHTQEEHVIYARWCLLNSLVYGESPFASHLLYPQVLNDSVPAEREQGISGQLAWIEACELMAVYADYGISEGMEKAIEYAAKIGKPIEFRHIAEWIKEAAMNYEVK